MNVRGFQAELGFNGGLASIDMIIASGVRWICYPYNQPQPGTKNNYNKLYRKKMKKALWILLKLNSS